MPIPDDPLGLAGVDLSSTQQAGTGRTLTTSRGSLKRHPSRRPKIEFPVKAVARIGGGLLGSILVVAVLLWACDAIFGISITKFVSRYAAAGTWNAYTSAEYEYSVSLPGLVEEDRGPANTPGHPHITQENVHGMTRDGSLLGLFVYSHFPRDWAAKYGHCAYGAHPHVKSTRFSMNGITGNEYRGKYLCPDRDSWRTVVARTFVANGRFFDMSIETDARLPINEEHVERFFSSFRLTGPIPGAQTSGNQSNE